MTGRVGLARRVQLAWAYVCRMEPARVQATAKGLLGLAALVGVSVPAGLDGRVTAVLGAVFGLLSLWQGEATRARVMPVAKVAEQAAGIVGVEYDSEAEVLVAARPPL